MTCIQDQSRSLANVPSQLNSYRTHILLCNFELEIFIELNYETNALTQYWFFYIMARL